MIFINARWNETVLWLYFRYNSCSFFKFLSISHTQTDKLIRSHLRVRLTLASDYVSTAARWRAAWCLRQSLLPGCVWEIERKYSCRSRAERQAKRYATQWVHQCHVSITPWDHIDCLSAPIGVRESVIHVWENDSEGGKFGLERSITGSGIQRTRKIMREKEETSAMMQLWFNLKSCINYANTFKSHVKYW